MMNIYDLMNMYVVMNIYDLVNINVCRIGRSGRFGRKGAAINFITRDDREMFAEVQKYYTTRISELPSKSTYIMLDLSFYNKNTMQKSFFCHDEIILMLIMMR